LINEGWKLPLAAESFRKPPVGNAMPTHDLEPDDPMYTTAPSRDRQPDATAVGLADERHAMTAAT
jgi:hypothetical protein